MKISLKLTVALTAAIAVLLAIYGYTTVRREYALFDQSMRANANMLGSVLATAIEDGWQRRGLERSLRLLDDSNSAEHAIQVRWVWLDAPRGEHRAPLASAADLTPVREGRRTSITAHVKSEDFLLTYVPLSIALERPAALELSESLTPMRAYVRNTAFRKVALFATLLVATLAIIVAQGVFLVGRPIQDLLRQVRRVGAGDLSGSVNVRARRDEIGELATEFNRMLKRLRQSQDRLSEETERRIGALEQLHHAERLTTIGKLASGVAHELGTPLNVVVGRARMIASRDLSGEEASQSAGAILEQADRITTIIRQLLDFARRGNAREQTLDLKDIVESVMEMVCSTAGRRTVTCSPETGRDKITVTGDRVKLQQVLTNLVMNAIQATAQDGRIEVSVGRESASPPADVGGPAGGFAYLRVVDDGDGITAENLGRIFSPFFTTKDVGEGTGLGLSIAYGIVRDHGGWIAAESRPGEGSRFTVYLPGDAG